MEMNLLTQTDMGKTQDMAGCRKGKGIAGISGVCYP
jgi:hypothetical protein